MQVNAADFSLPDKTIRVPKKELGQQDFLQLLMTQLRNQDPLEPQSNEQFIAQMAQFSTLELLNSLDINTQLARATQLIGRSVILKDSEKQENVQGVVEKVTLTDGQVNVYVQGKAYPLKSLLEITPVSAEQGVGDGGQQGG
ncbi:MAG: flagellar hook capping FlgD N-terminal domain-containing protein [Bacillota bacterium]|uniref:flagellar hook capping FlgD N-terminal domain-containing protein n=1 Tax=Desulfurispora thermophila TaxID=265470 RepID=UPI000363E2C9|nr:flagellar hook capping FlgD N-terminal domain-containing protein [Desulfurispora thermophila]